MIVVTTPTIPGYTLKVLGMIWSGNVAGINIGRDIFASMRNVFGGRAHGYEKELAQIQQTAINELVAKAKALNANAIVGVSLSSDPIVIKDGAMLMVSATGTAAVATREDQ